VLLDEGNEFVRGRGMDVIGVLGRLIVDFPRAECPLHQRIADSFHIDGHGPAVVRGGGAGGDMRMGAALILRVGKRQEPIGNVHLLKRDVHDGGNSRI